MRILYYPITILLITIENWMVFIHFNLIICTYVKIYYFMGLLLILLVLVFIKNINIYLFQQTKNKYCSLPNHAYNQWCNIDDIYINVHTLPKPYTQFILKIKSWLEWTICQSFYCLKLIQHLKGVDTIT